MVLSKLTALIPVLLLALFAASPAHAYNSVIDTGELIAPQKYQVSLEPQLMLDNNAGANITGRFDTGIDRDSSVRAILGTGQVQYEVGGMYKYVPYPDVGKQPALGGEVGATVSRLGGNSQLNLRFNPLISKKFETQYGLITPYGSLPTGLTSTSSETYIPIQLAGGAEWELPQNKAIHVFGELGINLNRAFSYVSVAIAYDFDDEMFGQSGPVTTKH